jgi:hypothetical protein
MSRRSKAALKWELQYAELDDFLADLPPEMQSAEYKNRPELTDWQRDILTAFYTLAKGRQSGFEANPIPLVDLVLMAFINDSVQFYGVMDLVEIWRELDNSMMNYWQEKREKDAKTKGQLEKQSSKSMP